MTTVDTRTGEIIEAVTAERARQITDRIRLLAESVADGIDRLVERIHEAQLLGVHEALGYRSWTDYVSTEFVGVLPRLSREPRRELVATLSETGMSSRAIAPVVGVSDRQVRNDIAGGKYFPPAGHLAPVADATTQSPSQEGAANSVGNFGVAPSPRTTGSGRPPVVGRDGKTYTRPEPATAPDEKFWNDAAEKATESGWVAKRDAERPFGLAVITLCHAAEDVAGIEFTPEHLAANLPAHVVNRVPEIAELADWLARFIRAAKENAA